MEEDTSLAPLAVKALRSLLLLFLRRPELVDVEPEPVGQELAEELEPTPELPMEPLHEEEPPAEAETLGSRVS